MSEKRTEKHSEDMEDHEKMDKRFSKDYIEELQELKAKYGLSTEQALITRAVTGEILGALYEIVKAIAKEMEK